MNAAAEFTAAFPEPQTILGLRLLPLSLGRYRLLKRFESPFVEDELKEISIETLTRELFFALAVCGLPCEEFARLLNNGLLAGELKRWGKVIKKHARQKDFNILKHFQAFKKYLDDGSAMPWVVLSRQDNSESSMSHWSTSIASTLRAKVGWSQKEIDEQPLSLALTDFLKYLEGEGIVRLYDQQTYKDIQAEARANGAAMEKIIQEMQSWA